MRPPTPCVEPGCNNNGQPTRCTQHSTRTRDPRPPAATRGYGRKWRAARHAILANALDCTCSGCNACNRPNQPTNHCPQPPTVVDHLDGQGPLGEHGYDTANLAALCNDCHNQKTADDTRAGRTRHLVAGPIPEAPELG